MDTNRISLAEIGTAPVEEPIYLQIGEATIEVRRSIPYEEVLEMMQWCIDMIVGEKPFLSAPLTRIVKDFAILNWYTNLDCGLTNGGYSEMSEIYAEYDVIKKFGVMEEILPKINGAQIKFFETTLDETMKSIVDYRNSAKGIVDALAADAQIDTQKMEDALAFMNDTAAQGQVKELITAAKNIKG